MKIWLHMTCPWRHDSALDFIVSTNLFDVHEIASIFQGCRTFSQFHIFTHSLRHDSEDCVWIKRIAISASSFAVTKRIFLAQVPATCSEYTITQQHFVDTFMSLFLDWNTVILGFALKLGTCLHELMANFVFFTKSSLKLWTQPIYVEQRKSTRIIYGIKSLI